MDIFPFFVVYLVLPTNSISPGEMSPKEPRLFSTSLLYGQFRVKEIINFDQTDLLEEDCFLLDIFTQLFVWIGSRSSADVRVHINDFAERFVREVRWWLR